MGKPTFQMRVQYGNIKEHWTKRKSLANCKITNEAAADKKIQLEEATQWCRDNDKRGWAAVSSGLFPLVKDGRAINRRLDDVVKTGKERQYCSILTHDEEMQLVSFVKNKNR